MKALIKTVSFDKEVDIQGKILNKFNCTYDDKEASFFSQNKDKPTFEAGKEYEFTETQREYNGKIYYNIRAIKQQGNSNYSRAVKKEQSKYSGFAMSYAKDLVIADKIKLDQISEYTKKMFSLMVELDKTLES